MTTLKQNLLNLAAQVAHGEYDGAKGAERLHNQVIRLWRGVEFAPPEGVSEIRYTVGDSAKVAVEIASTLTPETEPEDDAAAVCSEKRRHGVFARQGTTCPKCGWNKEA